MNPTWDEMVAHDPLIAFSWYLSGRKNCVLELGNEILTDVDGAFSGSTIVGGRLDRAEMLMWFWVLGAYEVIRTMCQAKACFTPDLLAQLDSLKKELAKARMPAAKMEQPSQRRSVTSNRSPAAWDLPNRDLLIGDPRTEMLSTRQLLKRFEEVVSGITRGDVLGRHENSYHVKA